MAECNVCRGRKYLRGDYPVDHPLFGKLAPCPNCQRARMPMNGQPNDYGLRAADLGLTFEDVLNIPQTNVAEAAEAVKATLAAGVGWIYLWGGYGTAKSMLLKAAVAQCLGAGQFACYTPFQDLLDEVRLAYDTKSPNEDALLRLRKWATIPVLAVDELEKAAMTEWATQRQFQLFDRRYEACLSGFGITLIASNEPPEELPGALASRVKDGRLKIIQLTGPDMRPVAHLFGGQP